MEIGIAVVLVIVMAVGFWLFNRKQRHELEEAKREKVALSKSLEEAEREKATLSESLESTEQEKVTLSKSLKAAEREKVTLSESLEEAEREKVTLSESLELVTKSNENALRLIHLFKLSLRGTTVFLHSERARATRLIKKYQKLEEDSRELHQNFQKTVTEYKEFREEVERKAKRRLARVGVGAALSLVPGIGLIQVANDLIELVNFANEIAEGADLSAIESFKLSDDEIESLAGFAVLSTIPLPLSEMPSDEDSTEVPGALTRDYQSIVKETFEGNMGPDIETPDISDLNAFVKDMIQRLKNAVKSVPESERRNEIAKIVNDFSQFGIASYDAGKAPKALVDGSSPGSKS